MEVIHRLEIPEAASADGQYVRLMLLQSGTHWGISVWHFDIFGFEVA